MIYVLLYVVALIKDLLSQVHEVFLLFVGGLFMNIYIYIYIYVDTFYS